MGGIDMHSVSPLAIDAAGASGFGGGASCDYYSSTACSLAQGEYLTHPPAEGLPAVAVESKGGEDPRGPDPFPSSPPQYHVI